MSDNAEKKIISTRDGYYVRATREHGAIWLCAGHTTVVGGLFGEWSDCESERDTHNRARRMIRRARREYTPNN